MAAARELEDKEGHLSVAEAVVAPLDANPLATVNEDPPTPPAPDIKSFIDQDHSGGGNTNLGAPTNATTGVSNPSSAILEDAEQFAARLDFSRYRELYHAAKKGDWESAKRFFRDDDTAVTARITVGQMTALHVAAASGQSEFVEKLVEVMPEEALAWPDCNHFTALHYAAMVGNIRVVKALLRKNMALTQIGNVNGYTPLLIAACLCSNDLKQEYKEVIWFLSSVTTDDPPASPFTGPFSANLIAMVTVSGLYDISLYLIKRYPNLATADFTNLVGPFVILALNPEDFPSGSKLGFWESCIYPFISVEEDMEAHQHPVLVEGYGQVGSYAETTHYPYNALIRVNVVQVMVHQFKRLLLKSVGHLAPGVRDAKIKHKHVMALVKHLCAQASGSANFIKMIDNFHMKETLAVAARNGITEIVGICLEYFPDILLIMSSMDTHNLFLIASEYRQEKIFSLLHDKSAYPKLFMFGYGLNILQTVAKLAPSPRLTSVSGPALHMQRELRWFKEVDNLVHPMHKRYVKNSEGKTAEEAFTEEHKKLAEKGEKWMKDTSNSSMLVATLIATVVFTAAFTVPGGNDDDGIPNFLGMSSFMVFAVSDALSLFSSLTSLLMFLSILTSRYAEEDFLTSLPKRLIIGLASLFFAIATMMVAFGATLSIVLSDRLKWVSAPLTVLASFPVTLFVMLQLPLFIQMVHSTYGGSIFRP